MKYGLTETTVENIRAVFARFPEIEKAILYGSRAKGNFKTGSDIDLTLCGKALTSDLCSAIASALDDLMLPYTIDLSVFSELNHAQLREHIERVGVLFYERANHGAAMKAEWKTKALGSLCDILDSQRKPITKRDRTPGEYPYYGATGILDFVEGYLFDEPLVLVGEDGAKWGSGENTAFAVQGKCWVNNHAHVLRPHRSVLTDNWLIYFLVHSDLSEFVSGLTVPKLNQGSLREIPIPVPPLPEQQRIVGILDEAFEGIATAKANAEKNLQNARALFESHLQSVFTQRGPGWVVLPIGEVAEVFDGPHATPKTVDAGPVFLGISALRDGKINLGETRHVTPEDFQHWTRRVKPQTDDVVFSYETRLGQAAIIPSGLECCLGRRMGLVRVNRKRLDPQFFVYQYISPPFREFLDSKTVRGATVDRIALKEFPSFPINLPRLDEQELIADQLESLRAETQRLESLYQQKLAALEALKKSLLHQAFTGLL